jgi:malate synthase
MREFRDEIRRAVREAHEAAASERHWMMGRRDETRAGAEAFRRDAREMARQIRAEMREIRDQIRAAAREFQRELRSEHRHGRGWI